MKLLLKLISTIESINKKIGSATTYLTALLVILVFYDVFARYVLQTSHVAVQELEWNIFAAIFLLGAAYTLQTDNHVRVDIFYSKFSIKQKAFIDFAGTILFLLPLCVVIIISSKDFVVTSFLINESSPDPGGLPARFIIKAILPVSFFLLLGQGIVLFLRSFFTLINYTPKGN
ncbi:MAG: TRAP transporter small permease subunit [Bacteroidetes bacterium]|nr:TRAP transporter small permease subunit [Bacteroidota bacterium]